MAWTQSAPDLPGAFGTAPVPDVEGLRRAALQASWRRDRRVAQRRMAVRWIAWYALRGLPLLAIAGAVFLGVSNRSTGRLAERTPAAPQRHAGQPELQLRLGSPLESASPIATATSTATATATSTATATPQAVGPQSTSVPLADKASSTTNFPSPQLRPDNWLHSQEP